MLRPGRYAQASLRLHGMCSNSLHSSKFFEGILLVSPTASPRSDDTKSQLQGRPHSIFTLLYVSSPSLQGPFSVRGLESEGCRACQLLSLFLEHQTVRNYKEGLPQGPLRDALA